MKNILLRHNYYVSRYLSGPAAAWAITRPLGPPARTGGERRFATPVPEYADTAIFRLAGIVAGKGGVLAQGVGQAVNLKFMARYCQEPLLLLFIA